MFTKNDQSLIYWIAGTLSFKFKEDKSLHSDEVDRVQPRSLILTKKVKQGTLITPVQDFLADVRKMYKLFREYHPLPNLRQGPGLIGDFTKLLVGAFPHRSPALLKEFTVLRTNQQIKVLNIIAKQGKKTLRGARNLAETINS